MHVVVEKAAIYSILFAAGAEVILIWMMSSSRTQKARLLFQTQMTQLWLSTMWNRSPLEQTSSTTIILQSSQQLEWVNFLYWKCAFFMCDWPTVLQRSLKVFQSTTPMTLACPYLSGFPLVESGFTRLKILCICYSILYFECRGLFLPVFPRQYVSFIVDVDHLENQDVLADDVGVEKQWCWHKLCSCCLVWEKSNECGEVWAAIFLC